MINHCGTINWGNLTRINASCDHRCNVNVIGMNLTQEKYNWSSKFLGEDCNMVKICWCPSTKVYPPHLALSSFRRPCHPVSTYLFIAHLLDLSHNYIKYEVTFALKLKRNGYRQAKQLLFIGNLHKYIQTSFQTINLKNLPIARELVTITNYS